MSTTELLLGSSFEGRVLRTLQSYFRRSNDVLLRESLWATGLEMDQVDEVINLLDNNHTVSEIMESLREKGAFNK